MYFTSTFYKFLSFDVIIVNINTYVYYFFVLVIIIMSYISFCAYLFVIA